MRIDIKQISEYHEKLRHLLTWLEDQTGFEFTITSPHRPGSEGVHGTMPLRGMDLRCRNEMVGHTIAYLINESWQYDQSRTNRSVCLIHGDGANLHIHLQVHENTTIKVPRS